MTNDDARARHLTLAVGGLLSVGTGLSLFGDALARKIETDAGHRPRPWFTRGTLALVLVNAGICLVVEAGKQAGFAGMTNDE